MFETGTFLLKDLISNQNTVHRMGKSLSEEKKRPDTRLPQSRAGGQRLYLWSLNHLGRGREGKDRKNQKKVKCDGRTNGQTNGRTNGRTNGPMVQQSGL